jgi:hypothetical protein
MARMTGGRYYTYNEASGVPDQVAREVKAASEIGIQPADKEIWDMPLLLALLVAILAAEWFIRHRNGLA